MSMVLYYVLSSLAALRITRFIVIDDLGQWSVKGPFQRHAVQVEADRLNQMEDQIEGMRKHGHNALADHYSERFTRAIGASPRQPLSLRQKISMGLDCPYCVGTWVSLGTLAYAAHAARSPKTKGRWMILAGALATSYAVGQVLTRLEEK